MRSFLLAASLAASLSACAPAGVLTPPPEAGAPVIGGDSVVVLGGAKALGLAELAYNSAASAALVATRAGLIRGETATTLRELNRKALATLAAGNAATDYAEKSGAARVLFGIVDQIKALTGAK